jgi:ribosome-interacting GTPase 1
MTKAFSEVADYPFTTQKPIPGMMKFENLQIQLVDTPPIQLDHVEPGSPTSFEMPMPSSSWWTY